MGRIIADAGDGVPQPLGWQPIQAQGPQNLVALKLRGVEEGQTGNAAWLLEGIETSEYRSEGPAKDMVWGPVPLAAVTGKQGEPEWSEDPAAVRLPALTSASYTVYLPCPQRQCGLDEIYQVDCGKCGAYDTCLESGLCEPGEAPVIEPDEDTGSAFPEPVVEEPHQPEVVETIIPDVAPGDQGAVAAETVADHGVAGPDNSGSVEAGGGSEDAVDGPEDKGGNKGGSGCNSVRQFAAGPAGNSALVMLFLVLVVVAAYLRRRPID